MKVCYTGGAVKDCGSYYSVATNAVELRIWFLTDDILRIRAGFDGDWDEASYSLTMTAWESRTDELMKDCRKRVQSAAAALTDGDIRKFFLRGGTPDQTVDHAANYHPLSVSVSERGKARSILQEHCIDALPVLNKRGIITDIIFAHGLDLDNRKQVDIPVVMMAGGLGTRLYPYTKILPKPLIPVGDLPIMEHIMRQFRQYGCTEFHGIVNYKKQLIKAYFSENEEHFNTVWYDEDKPLGTGGGLSLLKGKLSSTFFLTNCDLLIFTDYEKLLRFHRESGSAVTMVCAEKHVTIPYGVVETGESGVITAMQEKPAFQFLTNTGLYLVEPEVLDDIGEDEVIGFPDIIERQRRRGRRVSAYTVGEEDWLDMGQLDELEKMRERLYGKP